MALNIDSMDGTVQLVLDTDVLESILNKFPGIEVFAMPTNDGDIPTYGIRPKNL